jgi:hypothetical protein
MNRQRVIKFFVSIVVLISTCSVITFAQRERVGSEPRAVRTGRETTKETPAKPVEDPGAAARKQISEYGNTARIAVSGAVGVPRDQYEKAIAEAKNDYEGFVAQFTPGAPFAQTHVKLRFEDFAPAYFLVLNSEVKTKFRSGRELAERRAQRISYEKLLNREVGFDKDTAKSTVKDAKALVASFKTKS